MADKPYVSPDKLLRYHQGLKNIFAAKANTLAGYNITNAYTKDEIDDMIGDITSISFEVVQQLPAVGEAGVIYLVSNSTTGQSIYDEYIYINNTFEKIGTTDIDLSNYVQQSELIEITEAEIDTILAS